MQNCNLVWNFVNVGLAIKIPNLFISFRILQRRQHWETHEWAVLAFIRYLLFINLCHLLTLHIDSYSRLIGRTHPAPIHFYKNRRFLSSYHPGVLTGFWGIEAWLGVVRTANRSLQYHYGAKERYNSLGCVFWNGPLLFGFGRTVRWTKAIW